MTGTIAYVGLDVHARSTQAAALNVESGELLRAGFGAGVEPVLAWLRQLPQPVHACYEAGPTGYGLARAAQAVGIALDVVAPTKTARPAQLAAWLGLVPSLDQSGESSVSGSITKTGSKYARRLLVEAAWHYQRPPRIGVTLRNRQQGQPAHVLQIAWRAQHRLHRLYARLRARGKPENVITVAVARELACFLWAAAVV